MKNNFSEQGNLLLKHIDTADAICVGAAAGMSVAAGYDCAYHNDKYFEKYLGEFGRKYGFEGSFNGYYYRYQTSEERWAFLAASIYMNMNLPDGMVYQNLFELLEGKNYFIVTTNQDTLFSRRFPENKVSTIQGDFRYLQCVCPCHDELFESKELIEEMYANIRDCRIPTELIPHCTECGRELEPWVRGFTFLEGKKYREEYEKWNRFLLENKGKKILFLELGVGRMTPMFIREPFWNMTYSWSQAFYIAINPKDALLPKELKEKGITIKEDIADVLEYAVRKKRELEGKVGAES